MFSVLIINTQIITHGIETKLAMNTSYIQTYMIEA